MFEDGLVLRCLHKSPTEYKQGQYWHNMFCLLELSWPYVVLIVCRRAPLLRVSSDFGTPRVRMETDRIRAESDPDIIFYRILIRIQIFSNTNARRMSRIRIQNGYFTRFNSKSILLNSTYTNKILLLVHH
jgi:hypothetical protein